MYIFTIVFYIKRLCDIVGGDITQECYSEVNNRYCVVSSDTSAKWNGLIKVCAFCTSLLNSSITFFYIDRIIYHNRSLLLP